MKNSQTVKKSIIPVSHFEYHDIVDDANDFVCIAEDELIVVTGYGLYFYNYTDEIVHYFFRFGALYAVELLDETHVAFSGKIENAYKLVLFNYQTKEVADTQAIAFEAIQIKKISDTLLSCVGYDTHVLFYDFVTKEIVHLQDTKDHQGNVDRYWIKMVEIVDDEVIVYGGSDCRLSYFNHKTMKLLYTKFIGKWIHAIEVNEDKVVTVNKFSLKSKWLDRVLKGVPRTSAIQKMIVLENGNFLIFLEEHMILFDHAQQQVLWHVELNFYVHKVIQLDERRLAFLTTGQNLLIYDLNDKKIVFGYKIISVEDICRLDDKLLIYVTRSGMFSFDYKTYAVKDVSCFSINDARELCRIDDERVACIYGFGSFVCNVKTREEVSELHQSYSSSCQAENHLTLLDDEKIASSDYSGVFIDNYKNGDEIRTMRCKSLVQKILRFDDEILFIVEENGTLTPYNYKQDSILTQEIKLPYKSDIRDIIQLSDKHTAIQMRNSILIYEDILGACRCLESVKIYDETILSLYTYEKEQLTLINTQEPFLGRDDAYFDYYAKFIDLKSRKVFSYKELPQRVHLYEDEADKVLLT